MFVRQFLCGCVRTGRCVCVQLCVRVCATMCVCVQLCVYNMSTAIGGWVGGALFAIVQLQVCQARLPQHRHFLQLRREGLWAFYRPARHDIVEQKCYT